MTKSKCPIKSNIPISELTIFSYLDCSRVTINPSLLVGFFNFRFGYERCDGIAGRIHLLRFAVYERNLVVQRQEVIKYPKAQNTACQKINDP